MASKLLSILTSDQTESLRKFQLIWPLFFLLISGVEIFLFPNALSNSIEHIQMFQNIVFLNALHIVFSFFFVFSLKRSDEFVSHLRHESKVNILARSLLSFTLLFFIFYLIRSDDLLRIVLLNPIIMILPVHHGFQQSKGLMFLELKEVPSWFKITMEVFFWTLIIRNFALFLSPESYPVIATVWSLPAWPFIKGMLIGFPFILNLWVLIYLYQRESKSVLVFSLRFMLFHLQPFSTLALYAMGTVHGSEYFYVSSKLLSQENKYRGSIKHIFFATQAIGLILLSIIIWPTHLLPMSFLMAFPMVNFLSENLALALVYTHYSLDHYFFSARYPAAREYFLRILSK